MASGPEFRLTLYDNIEDYSKRQNGRIIASNEILLEKNVFLVGGRGSDKSAILNELQSVLNSKSSNVFHIPEFVYKDILNTIRKASGQKGFLLVDDFFGGDPIKIAGHLSELTSLVLDFPEFSFYIATDYDGYWTVGKSDPLNVKFKIAELTFTGVDQNASPPVEEEIIQQKVEPAENIVQKQEKVPRSKRKPTQFQPLSTKHDDIFREVINSSEFENLRNAEDFLMGNERVHYKAFVGLQNNPDVQSTARLISYEFNRSELSLEAISLNSKNFAFWSDVMQVVKDLSAAHGFSKSKRTFEDISRKNYPALEREWAGDLIRMLAYTEEKIVISPVITNYILFFHAPQLNLYIFEESIKKQIAEKVFEQEYDSQNFAPLVWQYFESLGQNNPKNPENLGFFAAAVFTHPRIRTIWDTEEQIQTQTPPPPAFNDGRVIGQYSPDEASEIDHLGFKHDVHALAALVAYDKTPLPLAIGLFGNWGSGKSSFMKQLEKRINVLSKEQYDNKELVNVSKDEMPYCSNIVHITFNAWHYSDANLWASMMVHIFDQLLEKIQKTISRDQLKENLINKLSTAREALKEAEKQLQESTHQRTDAEHALAKVKLSKTDIDAQLANVKLSLGDVVSALMTQDQFRSDLKFIAKESGFEKLVQTKEELETLKAEMQSRGKRWKRAILNLVRGNVQFAWFFLLLIFTPAVLVALQKSGVIDLHLPLGSLLVSPLALGGWLLSQFKRFDGSLEKIESLQSIAENKVRSELEIKEKALSESLAVHNKVEQEKQKQLEDARKNEKDAKELLEAIDINRQLTSFIQHRQGGNSYQQHLGIISLIRKDFEELRTYLNNCRKEKKGIERSIDRIVLYIDDLDRCKTDRVVAVLEAVHLLLAIDLFVVVVGVDPRWVSKALKEQYKEQLHLDAAEDSDTSRLPGQRATPFDYLEKIFQVPFVLRSMNNDGAKKLLDNLFKGQVKKKGEDPSTSSGQKKEERVDYEQRREKILNTDQGNFMKNLQLERLEKEKKSAEESEEAKKKKAEEEKEKQKEFIEQVENLTISEEELEFMKDISPIIGSTPRTVKRYGNLYRLLRVHSDLPNYSIDNLPIYQSVMLLLSISVSNGSIARPFFAALKDSKKTGFYEMNQELIDALDKQNKEAQNKKEEKDDPSTSSGQKEKEDALHEQLQALNQLHNELGKLPDEIKNFSVATLKKYSPVVSRFSFRTLNCVEEETIQNNSTVNRN